MGWKGSEYRKAKVRIGELKLIEVPKKWRFADGIIASAKETNMGLAKRDYSKECRTGSEPLIVVEGHWLWWCNIHLLPELKCIIYRAQEKRIEEKVKEF